MRIQCTAQAIRQDTAQAEGELTAHTAKQTQPTAYIASR